MTPAASLYYVIHMPVSDAKLLGYIGLLSCLTKDSNGQYITLGEFCFVVLLTFVVYVATGYHHIRYIIKLSTVT